MQKDCLVNQPAEDNDGTNNIDDEQDIPVIYARKQLTAAGADGTARAGGFCLAEINYKGRNIFENPGHTNLERCEWMELPGK